MPFDLGLGAALWMAAAVFAELTRQAPKPRFTVGINDDVTHLSLPIPDDFEVASDALTAVFYGLGSDGTVGAAKNTVNVISAAELEKWKQASSRIDDEWIATVAKKGADGNALLADARALIQKHTAAAK